MIQPKTAWQIWLVTEAAQLVVTLVVLLGGGYLLTRPGVSSQLSGVIETMAVAVVSFWLGSKAQSTPKSPVLPPASLTDQPAAPAEKPAIQGQ